MTDDAEHLQAGATPTGAERQPDVPRSRDDATPEAMTARDGATRTPPERPFVGARFVSTDARLIYEVRQIDGHVVRLNVHHETGETGWLSVWWEAVLRDYREAAKGRQEAGHDP